MTNLALIRIEDNEVLGVYLATAKRIDVPGERVVIMPPEPGWEGGGALITTEGPPRFRLVEVEGADVPDGKRVVSERVVYEGGATARVEVEFEDIPPPPEPPAELTRAEKLERLLSDYGLSRDDLKAELADDPVEDVKAR